MHLESGLRKKEAWVRLDDPTETVALLRGMEPRVGKIGSYILFIIRDSAAFVQLISVQNYPAEIILKDRQLLRIRKAVQETFINTANIDSPIFGTTLAVSSTISEYLKTKEF